MKRKFSLNALLRNNRILFVFSVVLAIVIWALVVYGPSNEQDRTISGVPVTVSLGDYAMNTLNMRIVEGHDITATVKVHGRRSVVEQLTAQDVLLTADTSTVISPGTYTDLTIRATKNGKQTDFDIVSIDPLATELTCDVWVEQSFDITAKIDGITSADETKYQIGTPIVSSDTSRGSTVTISGPKTEMDTIAGVVATVEEKEKLSETKVFNATLKAVDGNGNEANITHCTMNTENADIKVTVPILFYKRLNLAYQLQNVPAAYKDSKDLVKFTPSYLELWGSLQDIETFETTLAKLTTFNFDTLTGENLTQTLPLSIPENLKILGGIDEIAAKFNLRNIRSKKLNVTLTDKNIDIINCPAGVKISFVEKALNNITLYGPSNVINRIRATDLKITVDVKNDATQGQKTLTTRVSIPNHDGVWVYYGDNATGYTLLATVG